MKRVASNIKLRSPSASPFTSELDLGKDMHQQHSPSPPISKVPSLLQTLLVAHHQDNTLYVKWRLLSYLLLSLLSIVCALNLVWAGQWMVGTLHPAAQLPHTMLASVQVHDSSNVGSTYIVNATLMPNTPHDARSSEALAQVGVAAVQALTKQEALAGSASAPDSYENGGNPLKTTSSRQGDGKREATLSPEPALAPAPTESKEAQPLELDTLVDEAPPSEGPLQQPEGAELYPMEVLPTSPDPCSHAAQLPKVALLFLTRGRLFHELSWRLWFESAKNMIPVEIADTLWCSYTSSNTSSFEAVHQACRAPTDRPTSIATQHLFSVYIHAPPEVSPEEVGELWADHLIQHRIQPEWGTHALVQATRNLVWEAVRDPLNQRFVLLSESDMPIYDPLTFYRQMMSEIKSRVNAWPHGATDVRRWSWRMASGPSKVHRSFWRKSSQWFSLQRHHAVVLLRDRLVFRAFEKHCVNRYDEDYNRWRDCFSDEHYLSTLLAVQGLTQETVSSMAGICATDWSRGGAHPYTYIPSEVTSDLVRTKLRPSPSCDPGTLGLTQDQAYNTFLRLDELEEMYSSGDSGNGSVCVAVEVYKEQMYVPMDPTCSLTARKFGQDAVDQVLNNVFLDCSEESGARMLRRDICLAAHDRIKNE